MEERNQQEPAVIFSYDVVTATTTITTKRRKETVD